MMEMMNVKDYDVSANFLEEKTSPKSTQEITKKRTDRTDTEEYYLQKFRGYILSNNLIARLQSKYNSINKALAESDLSQLKRPPSLPPKPKKRRIGRTNPMVGQPKLFGGNIEEYVDATGQEIPCIISSCIRIINLYGMHHQGIFRVPGAIVEINEFKAQFERGEDPLQDIIDAKDLNSVAGVLKLYFRELQEPLFPLHLFDEFIAASKYENTQDCIERIKELVSTLPRVINHVMRYLFAFLNHLTEYSDENMMDPYNLAICFGPTLCPIPSDRDQVQYHANVNDLIKNILINYEEIYPYDGSGPQYQKCITVSEEGDRDIDVLDTLENLSDEEGVFPPSDDESDCLEAVAQYDFSGRSNREISFRKGDVLTIYSQVSDDWWSGSLHGREGLIPDKYVKLQHKDQLKINDEKDKRRSTESLPVKSQTRLSMGEEIDKSASQPNIAMMVLGDKLGASHVDTDTDSSQDSIVNVLHNKKPAKKVEDFSTEDIAQDIDNTLAEVMNELQSLEMQQKQDREKIASSERERSGNPKHTPDLVLDLPVNTGSSSPRTDSQSSDPDSPSAISSADTFAESNQSTIKKGSSLSMPRSFGNTVFHSDMQHLVQRSASTNATIRERNNRDIAPPALPPSSRKNKPLPPLPVEDDNPKPVPARREKFQDDRERSATPPPLAPKPGVKVKPPLMKKPERSPQLMKKLGRASPTPSSQSQ